MGRGGRDFFEHIVPLDQFAEGSVFAIEETRGSMTDEKLAAGGIRVIGAGH